MKQRQKPTSSTISDKASNVLSVQVSPGKGYVSLSGVITWRRKVTAVISLTS